MDKIKEFATAVRYNFRHLPGDLADLRDEVRNALKQVRTRPVIITDDYIRVEDPMTGKPRVVPGGTEIWVR